MSSSSSRQLAKLSADVGARRLTNDQIYARLGKIRETLRNSEKKASKKASKRNFNLNITDRRKKASKKASKKTSKRNFVTDRGKQREAARMSRMYLDAKARDHVGSKRGSGS